MPASTKTMRICFLYCSCILFFCSAKLHAQNPHLDIKAPYSVSVVGAEQLEARSVTIGNVTELILRLPKTHALVQRNSTYDYSLTGGGQRNDLIYFNREKDPVYLRSVVTDQNAVPILAIEEIRVLKNVESGYKWQNMPGKQYAFQFDAGTKKYKDIAFTGTYKPQFVVPLFADNGEMISNTSWLDKINLMLSKKTFSETKPDDAYGDGGSAIYNYKQFPGFANIETETIQYKDLNGTVREEIYREKLLFTIAME